MVSKALLRRGDACSTDVRKGESLMFLVQNKRCNDLVAYRSSAIKIVSSSIHAHCCFLALEASMDQLSLLF